MKIFLIIIIFASAGYGQNWQKDEGVFSSSGISVKNFSAPAWGDLNGDGFTDLILGNLEDRADVFINNGGGFPASFRRDDSLLSGIYSGGAGGVNSAYPYLTDLDNDGDLDLIIGGYNGILYYQNTGTAENPLFEKIDTLFQSVNLEIGTDGKPAFADLDGDGDFDLAVGTGESLTGGPDAGIILGFRNIGAPEQPEFIADSGFFSGIGDVGLNCYPDFADLDGDGDFDMIIGRDGGQIYYFRNDGNLQQPNYVRDNSLFSVVESSTYWKNPSFVDLDYDGDYDLVYGTSSGGMYVYRNTGTASNPHFQYYADYFKIIKIDGNNSTISFADFDGDGDFDLMSGIWTGKFIYFENKGGSDYPSFKETNASFSNLTSGSYSHPVFIDLDGDGDEDIVSGALNGGVYYYVNNGNSFTQNSDLFSGINTGGFSAPAFADLDNDGDYDLLVGGESGSDTKAFVNISGAEFVENDELFAGISFPSYCSPALADVDNDGDIDLTIGSLSGALTYYENIGDRRNPVWRKDLSMFAGIEAEQNANPGFADLDGDTRPDLILGEYNGNFTFYKNLFALVSAGENQSGGKEIDFYLYQNYPNPFNPETKIKYSIQKRGFVNLSVFDVLGKRITELVNKNSDAGKYEIVFNSELTAGGLPSGIYFYRLTSGALSITRKMILLR